MTLQFHKTENAVLEIVASDKLSKHDYTAFVKEAEDSVQHYGKLRLLVELRDFHGWDTETIWEDLKFDARHVHRIERIAVIGEKVWHERTTILFRPFTAAQVRYFVPEQAAQAHAWIEAKPYPSPAAS